ncbi:hypothetical protein LSH36_38g01027 [Paralvinella palmiformis]|uniref:KxDL domain-containing protein n=1 Tax=Paralvinella palmiformis TaxID=53620 RepID=A0AAD9K8Q7_9ANNE|nr:hypothetical protein LSH36_38g01027 [Paralvinella palmiformis]
MDSIEDTTFERHLSPVARLLAAHDISDPCQVFLETLSSSVNSKDVEEIKEAQQQMLQRFEKTNEMLLNFNALSSARYETTARDFKHHTQLLAEMRSDLNDIFKRIRSLKTQLSKQHPDAFKVHGQVAFVLEEEDEEDEDTIKEDSPSFQTSPKPEQLSISLEKSVPGTSKQIISKQDVDGSITEEIDTEVNT